MIQLSKNFNSIEFACPCCGRWKVDPELVQKLQQLRDHLGYPIIITSGYRCPRYNNSIGGFP
jgi:hypothetical protein